MRIAVMMLLALGGAGQEPARAALTVKDVHGATHTLFAAGDQKATALIFITTDCPIANGYAPEINRICAAYASQPVAFYLVHADPDTAAPLARKHARDYRLRCPVLLDPAHQLVELTQVTITPEVAVLAPDGTLLYRGRIDDSYAALGKKRPQPTTHELRDALDAILKGQPVAVATTKAVGCYIPNVKGGRK